MIIRQLNIIGIKFGITKYESYLDEMNCLTFVFDEMKFEKEFCNWVSNGREELHSILLNCDGIVWEWYNSPY